MSAFWVCGDPQNFHYFEFGQLGWHLEAWANQGFDEGQLVPNVCQAEGCVDSSHLWGPFDDERLAVLIADARRYTAGLPLRREDNKAWILVAIEDRRRAVAGNALETMQVAREMAQTQKNSPGWHGENGLLYLGGLLDDSYRRGLERFL